MPESYASFETALPHYGCVPEAVYTTSSVSPGRKRLSDAPIPKCIHGRRIQRDPSRARWRRLCDALFGERGLDRSWIAELWRAQTEKADPLKDSA